jgi:hypothetical protein
MTTEKNSLSSIAPLQSTEDYIQWATNIQVLLKAKRLWTPAASKEGHLEQLKGENDDLYTMHCLNFYHVIPAQMITFCDNLRISAVGIGMVVADNDHKGVKI